MRKPYPRINKHQDKSPSQYVRGGEVKGREQRFQSGNAVFRRADPDNMATADKQINMAVDYEDNMKIVPDGFVRSLGHSGPRNYRGMNVTGKSIALKGITVGSGTDDKGVI
jgi:hypothetical protein